ncbi:dicarboxylate/amino acid:cation symporter [Shouchella shacheensis]|uniref:dicarboxylate/amino acid:cation symporter n=1 Tax=Shouchella shacheensis TaxID=1649580 RepID=UPI00073FDD6F|nr:dicarboxylate/amino acid:cation symporter [Shouchella shacheensis]
MKLILKLLLGIVAGIGIGLLANEGLARFMVTVSDIIGSFIFFMVPLIILFFITAGIASLGKGAGRILGTTVGTAYLSSFLAGTFAVSVAMFVIPSLGITGRDASEPSGMEGFLDFTIEPVFGVLTALVLAFVFGIGIAASGSQRLQDVAMEGQKIVDLVIRHVIIPLLPFYIAGVFTEMSYEGTVLETLGVFGIVLLLAVGMHLTWLLVQYTVAGAASKRNPFVLLKTMLPAYFTALGTMSSAATIPVTLESVKKTKISNSIANFVVPLCANIHLSGSTITVVTAATAVMYVYPGLEFPGFLAMIPVILMLGIIMVAAPGVPGGAVMAATGVLISMLGFDEGAVALMIALYLAQDSFGTAANVTGDGAIAILMDKVKSRWLKKTA